MSIEITSSPLDAKLNPPSGSTAQIVRQRITDVLAEARSARLVLVRAPAGFGKTTAMQQYRNLLDEQQIRTAWITLDRGDNDITRFMHCLAYALRPIIGSSSRGNKELNSLLNLINRLQQYGRPFVLFLDEYEVIRDNGVLSLVREIIESLPRTTKVVIGTRTTPSLGLGRLRARGHLVELDAEALRFSVDETRDYLTIHRSLPLSPDDVLCLHKKTEGWIAGLWLASAALTRVKRTAEFIARFSGSSLDVAEYLTEDVLNVQSPDMREFLLQTSVLRTLNPDLCRALFPHLDIEDLLHNLDSENILVTRVGGEEQTYRYHSLFANFLQVQLKRQYPEAAPRIHRAASTWYIKHGRPVPAIDHALAAGDTEIAVQLLDQYGIGLLRDGRMQLLTRWLHAIPPTTLADHPLLLVIQAWAICFTRGAGDAMLHLQHCGLETSDQPSVKAHLLAIRPVLLALMDRVEEAYEYGKASVPHLPTGDSFADAALLSVLADTCSAKGLTGEAFRLLNMLRTTHGGAIGALNDMYTQTAEGTIALLEGRLREATARFRIAVSANVADDTTFTNGNAWAGVLFAAAIYESNDLDQATLLLRVYLPLAREVGMPDHLILSYRMLARIAIERADLDEAFRLLTELEDIGHRRKLPRLVASARLERSRLHLRHGHIEAAREELDRASDQAIWASVAGLKLPANEADYPELVRLRWEIFGGDPVTAAKSIEREISTSRKQRRLYRALKLQLLHALALHRAGEATRAIAEADVVLRECQQEAFVRLALDEGKPFGILVRALAVQIQPSGQPPQHDAYSNWLHRLLELFGDLPHEAREAPSSENDNEAAEQLTQQELKVLNLLAEGYSNKRMADKLAISDSTVRTHLRSINTKLRVRSRLQAVAIGRAYGLLT